MKLNVTFFDFETNGLGPSCSVLSACAMKGLIDTVDFTLEMSEEYWERYYFPREAYDRKAIEINGLSEEEVRRRRARKFNKQMKGEDMWPRFFSEDLDTFVRTCLAPADIIVAHNLSFDIRFVEKKMKEICGVRRSEQFCTMVSNTDIVKAGGQRTLYGSWKWPKLVEAARFYNLILDDESPISPPCHHRGDTPVLLNYRQEIVQQIKWHEAQSDVAVLVEIFRAMLAYRNVDVVNVIQKVEESYKRHGEWEEVDKL